MNKKDFSSISEDTFPLQRLENLIPLYEDYLTQLQAKFHEINAILNVLNEKQLKEIRETEEGKEFIEQTIKQ